MVKKLISTIVTLAATLTIVGLFGNIATLSATPIGNFSIEYETPLHNFDFSIKEKNWKEIIKKVFDHVNNFVNTNPASRSKRDMTAMESGEEITTTAAPNITQSPGHANPESRSKRDIAAEEEAKENEFFALIESFQALAEFSWLAYYHLMGNLPAIDALIQSSDIPTLLEEKKRLDNLLLLSWIKKLEEIQRDFHDNASSCPALFEQTTLLLQHYKIFVQLYTPIDDTPSPEAIRQVQEIVGTPYADMASCEAILGKLLNAVEALTHAIFPEGYAKITDQPVPKTDDLTVPVVPLSEATDMGK